MFFKIVGRLTIYFFRGLGRTTLRTGRFTFRHPIVTLFVLAVVGGLSFFAVSSNVLGALSSPSGNIQPADGVTGNPREASVSVLKGLTNYNAAMMWEGFSQEYRDALTKNNMSQAKLQEALDKVKQINQSNGNAVVYDHFTWQGFGTLRDGSGRADVFEAVLTVGGKTPASAPVYALKVDAKDRVREVASDDPILASTLFATFVRSQSALVKPSDASTRLLLGLSHSSADEIWKSLSDDYRQQLNDQGISQQNIQDALSKNSGDTRVVYDHFTLRPSTTTTDTTTEQFTGFATSGSTKAQYNYTISNDGRGNVSEIVTTDPVLINVFYGAMVSTNDPALKPRPASSQAFRGISQFEAKDIWASLSDDYKAALNKDGFDQTAMQKSIDDALKELTAINEKPSYQKFELMQVGQMRDNGAPVELYNVTIRVSGRDTMTSFVIKFDNKDKITDVTAQDPIVSAAFKKPSVSSQVPQTGSDLLSPSYTAERLMVGLTTFDTQRVWAALSASYQKELQTAGVTPTTMNTVLNQFKADAKSQNVTLNYVGYNYVGGKSYPAGNSESSYTSTLKVGDRAGQFDYLLVMDTNGKIQAITTTDPILNAMLGRQQSTNGQ